MLFQKILPIKNYERAKVFLFFLNSTNVQRLTRKNIEDKSLFRTAEEINYFWQFLYTSIKQLDCFSLIEEVKLMGGLWNYFLVTPRGSVGINMQIFRPVQLVVLAVEGKTGFGFGTFI